MFENPGRGWQVRNFTTNVPKIIDLKSSSEHTDIFRKLTLGAPDLSSSADLHEALILIGRAWHVLRNSLKKGLLYLYLPRFLFSRGA